MQEMCLLLQITGSNLLFEGEIICTKLLGFRQSRVDDSVMKRYEKRDINYCVRCPGYGYCEAIVILVLFHP